MAHFAYVVETESVVLEGEAKDLIDSDDVTKARPVR